MLTPFKWCSKVTTMKATKNLPKQSEIEAFLGKEFFPKYNRAIPLSEVVDMVQLEFEVSDENRSIRCPSGHGSDGTIIECLTRFALLRLEEKQCVLNLGQNIFRWNGRPFVGKVSRREVNEAAVSLKILMSIGKDKDTAVIELAGKWDDDVVLTAADKVYGHENT